MIFTAEQSQKYYETRMGGEIRRTGASYMGKCPFHDDTHASMSFDFEKGVWHCHAECATGGGMVDFEQRLNGCSKTDAVTAINTIMGVAQTAMTWNSGKPEAIYEYRDEQDRLLFQIVKTRDPATGKKRISNRRPVGKGWEYSIKGTRLVLYRLIEVIRASEVFIVEGEKCADAVCAAYCDMQGETDACLAHGFTATTSSHGAGKWRDEFAPFFAGKKVVLVPDNDGPGRDHMEMVAASVSRYALGVKWLELPLHAEKDDVADFLVNHTFHDLQLLAAKAPFWQPRNIGGMFLSAKEFVRHVPAHIEWLVEGVIERGTSGFVIALPKSGKSFATIPLAVALASGGDWLGCKVPKAVRTALVSREDASGLTSRRMRRAMIGMGRTIDDPIFDTNLYVNTRQQTPELMLDDDEQLAELIREMKAKRIEFAILDVLNVLHGADENDNTEMRRVLMRVNQIRKEVGCEVCIIHHSVKDDDGNKTLSQLARGSSAISGFAEFIIGVRMIDEATQTRQMRFETKSAEPLHSFFWKIRDHPLTGAVTIERAVWEGAVKKAARSTKIAELAS